MDEAIARRAESVRAAVKETLGVDFEDIDTNNIFIQMMIFKEVGDNALAHEEGHAHRTAGERIQYETDSCSRIRRLNWKTINSEPTAFLNGRNLRIGMQDGKRRIRTT